MYCFYPSFKEIPNKHLTSPILSLLMSLSQHWYISYIKLTGEAQKGTLNQAFLIFSEKV